MVMLLKEQITISVKKKNKQTNKQTKSNKTKKIQQRWSDYLKIKPIAF